MHPAVVARQNEFLHDVPAHVAPGVVPIPLRIASNSGEVSVMAALMLLTNLSCDTASTPLSNVGSSAGLFLSSLFVGVLGQAGLVPLFASAGLPGCVADIAEFVSAFAPGE